MTGPKTDPCPPPDEAIDFHELTDTMPPPPWPPGDATEPEECDEF